ncbi:MAG TPA: hypothetical protein VGD58_05000 [Herpetosiphonaceae bacterium]
MGVPFSKNQEQGAKNQEPRTKNRERRTKNQEPRTKNQEPRIAPAIYGASSIWTGCILMMGLQDATKALMPLRSIPSNSEPARGAGWFPFWISSQGVDMC